MTGRLFNGGCPHLRFGDLVLPPAVTGAPAAPLDYKRPDRVYVCEDTAVTAYFGRLSTHGHGAAWSTASVYEVDRVGVLEVDPFQPGDVRNLLAVEMVLWERARRRGAQPASPVGDHHS